MKVTGKGWLTSRRFWPGTGPYRQPYIRQTKFAKFHGFMGDHITGKNNRFPFLDISGYFKNTLKNPKFGRARQVPTRELGWEFPGWDLSHFAKFGIFVGIL